MIKSIEKMQSPLLGSPRSPQRKSLDSPKREEKRRRHSGSKLEEQTPLFHEIALQGGMYTLVLAPRLPKPISDTAHTEETLQKLLKREYKQVCKENPCNTHKMKFEDKQRQFPTSCHFQNWHKNRYPDVLCNEDSRFVYYTLDSGKSLEDLSVLQFSESQCCEKRESQDRYINANYIRGAQPSNTLFIATQAPLEHTLADFYEMLWQSKSGVLVTLSGLVENNKVKMIQFWPSSTDKALQFAHFSVLLLEERDMGDDIRVRRLLVHNLEANTSRTLQQIHFTGWPDSGVPASPVSLNKIFQIQRKAQQEGLSAGLDGPVVCHCSAGIGRTATYVCFVLGAETIEYWKGKMEKVSRQFLNDKVRVPALVADIRKQRSGSVQTWEQYALIYHALNYFLKYEC